ncbi:PspC domain-containing protein [Legionella dresdenensis]|uniref:PspC domain-containing protein n=1 Tax=Legionella dresdenensis TaxID=450200 RepID=A0ABV8CDA5_9GAMM
MKQLSKSGKRLYRSRTDRMIAGVCGGLATYFEMDPSWVRILFILFLLLGGCAILVYLIMWLVVPKEPLSEIK